jgi:formate hydrogenlyase subunit 4
MEKPAEPAEPIERMPLPRWVTPLFTIAAVVLLPWTLWLTFTLPSRFVTRHYDLAWVGFDIALAGAFAGTSWAALRASRWLVPLAAATGTMLVCDAWFDVVTSVGSGELVEAVLEAVFVELPLAAICGFIVYDAETFLQATVRSYATALRRRRDRA